MNESGAAPRKVLVVDDELSIRHFLSALLQREGIDVHTATNGQEALEMFAEIKPDLVLMDVMMPIMDGFEVCKFLKSDPETRLTPIIIITASSNKDNRIKGLEYGADDFLSKPVDRVELIARVRSLLRIKGYMDELDRAESVLCALARSIEGKDPNTEGHCERLSLNAVKLGRRLSRPAEELVALRRAGIVHDIGKVAVPDAILLKPGRLTDEEMAIIREHPVVGEQICMSLKTFQLVLPIIRHHHERRDGSGYPDGLSGDQIPVSARIMQVVDVFDALTTERPYKDAMSAEEALRIMNEEVEKGWWDPAVFAEFRRMILEEGFETEVLKPVVAGVS